MKKTIFLLSIFLVTSHLIAQEIKSYGPKIALTNSGLDSDFFPESFSNITGFSVGFSAEIFPINFFSVVLELNYTQKGFSEKSLETNDDGELIKEASAENKLFYISVPIMFKFKYQRKLSPYISIGPRFDYLAAKKNGVFNYSTGKYKSDLISSYDNFVFGASGAVGLEITGLISVVTVLEFRYNLDFNDSLSENKYIDMKNKSLDIWLGFLF